MKAIGLSKMHACLTLNHAPTWRRFAIAGAACHRSGQAIRGRRDARVIRVTVWTSGKPRTAVRNATPPAPRDGAPVGRNPGTEPGQVP